MAGEQGVEDRGGDWENEASDQAETSIVIAAPGLALLHDITDAGQDLGFAREAELAGRTIPGEGRLIQWRLVSMPRWVVNIAACVGSLMIAETKSFQRSLDSGLVAGWPTTHAWKLP